MISQSQRGADRASYIIGKSVHSQRVERLKHNVFYAVNWLYYKNIQYLNEITKWSVTEVHIWALQYTFAPRVNHALTLFEDSWNAHPLSKEKNRSPEQFWILQMNIQKGDLYAYELSSILIPQVKCFHTVFRFLVSTWERIYGYSKHF